ncbi:IS4 family transposase [Caballeronia ptereochthonis]|uniref:IS4 family transposase n=1 Tax=Caballeronia ptereochthonis TaxID=1777144 RepID=A0A157ZRG2_9BURK|nr:IS4 family transposase [Caballeronia ptereochthonis]
MGDLWVGNVGYTRMNRWSKAGVLDRVFTELQREQIVRIKIEAVSMDSTMVKVHPDGTGALKKGPQAIGKSRGGWTTKIHMVAADARTAITFALSPGQAGDAPEGRALLQSVGRPNRPLHLLMDKAYEGDETRQLALDLGFIPVVPPKSNRLAPGNTTAKCTSAEMKLKACFVALRASVVSPLDSTNWTSCSSPLSISRSSSMGSDSVNRP